VRRLSGVSLYPLNGNVAAHIGGVQASTLIAQRMTAKMHRELLVWGAAGNRGQCGYYPQPLMDKRNYKMTMLHPVPQTDKLDGRCCQPYGRTTAIWGAGKEFPYQGEDFAYLIFRKRNCCASVSLLPAWLLSLAAWGAPPGLPDEAALRAEMARQKARGEELLIRRAEETFRADPGRPVQSAPQVTQPRGHPLSRGPTRWPLAERYRQTQGTKGKQEIGPDLLVFVSFAMPRASLERLAADAAKADGGAGLPRAPRMDRSGRPCRPSNPWPRLGARAILHPEAFTRHRIEGRCRCTCWARAGGGCDDAADSCTDGLAR
jgi:hypothetical protein